MAIRFGPSGNSESFYEQGYKHTRQAPEYLAKMGLDAFEYSFGRGVRMSQNTASAIRASMEEYGIALSVHAPYFINLCVEDEERVDKNRRYFLETARAARMMGADRAVFHPGAVTNMTRERAMELAQPLLKRILDELEDEGLGSVRFCAETMGKLNQFGDLDEMIRLCAADERLIPAVDFAHLHARGNGALNSTGDFEKVLDALENGLGKERAKKMHVHFSTIEYTKMGEKRHRTFAETDYGPRFEHLAPLLVSRGYEPRIICESNGTMAEDAKAMRDIYFSIKNS
ncbi:MAG: TIM barrel protein [Christensenellales bacterium]|jgi:deoxyribonuclease-4